MTKLSIKSSQQERLMFIDYTAYFTGTVNRIDICNRFGSAASSATKDFHLYFELNPDSMIYKPATRKYHATASFSPFFGVPKAKGLRTLLEKVGINDNASECDIDTGGTLKDLSVLSALTRALRLNQVVKVEYVSVSSGKSAKQLVPHNIFYSGLFWYVRCFDVSKNRFADFQLNRFLSVLSLPALPIAQCWQQGADLEYNNTVELKVVPHPRLSEQAKDSVAMTFNMVDGFMKKRIRSSFIRYFLSRWNIAQDSSSAKTEACVLMLDEGYHTEGKTKK